MDVVLPIQEIRVEEEKLKLLEATEKTSLIKKLVETHYYVSKAASNLDILRMTMRYRIEKHNL